MYCLQRVSIFCENCKGAEDGDRAAWLKPPAAAVAAGKQLFPLRAYTQRQVCAWWHVRLG
jgi:hypothetical protein